LITSGQQYEKFMFCLDTMMNRLIQIKMNNYVITAAI